MPRESFLDNFLQSKDFDEFLIKYTSANSNMYYLTGFEASDPYTYLRRDEESIIMVPPLELSRA
ncbi:MAG: Xaa-Pro aminopeptidase [Candidatus Nanohaloarchaea archaeon]|jgi:Xaa-Pro aminopeptidase